LKTILPGQISTIKLINVNYFTDVQILMELYQFTQYPKIEETELWPVIEIFDDFILRRNGNISMRTLMYDGRLLYQPFVDRLQTFKYRSVPINSVNIEAGWRIPAFVIKDKYAIFGHVHIAESSTQPAEKMFASDKLDVTGQPRFKIIGKSDTIVFMNPYRQEKIIPHQN
jgi:hypothetical protein